MINKTNPYTVTEWYREKYPTDEIELDWLDGILWDDIKNCIDHKSGPLCEWCDSVVRERVFTEASKRFSIDYDVLFDLWIEDKL